MFAAGIRKRRGRGAESGIHRVSTRKGTASEPLSEIRDDHGGAFPFDTDLGDVPGPAGITFRRRLIATQIPNSANLFLLRLEVGWKRPSYVASEPQVAGLRGAARENLLPVVVKRVRVARCHEARQTLAQEPRPLDSEESGGCQVGFENLSRRVEREIADWREVIELVVPVAAL